ncbi:hypothetical protein ACWDSD_33700 [Streptomyces spiralis]
MVLDPGTAVVEQGVDVLEVVRVRTGQQEQRGGHLPVEQQFPGGRVVVPAVVDGDEHDRVGGVDVGDDRRGIGPSGRRPVGRGVGGSGERADESKGDKGGEGTAYRAAQAGSRHGGILA